MPVGLSGKVTLESLWSHFVVPVGLSGKVTLESLWSHFVVPVGLSGKVTLESLFSHFVDRAKPCHLVSLESLCLFKRNRVFSHFGVTFNYSAYKALCPGTPILTLDTEMQIHAHDWAPQQGPDIRLYSLRNPDPGCIPPDPITGSPRCFA